MVCPGYSFWYSDSNEEQEQANREREDNTDLNRNKCELDADPGVGYASITKWYYNNDRKLCEEFLYGGERGNDNKFDSERECYDECGDAVVDNAPLDSQRNPNSAPVPAECSLPKEKGPCRAKKPRYYFNSNTGMCKVFYYGGCRGNENNFETMKECENKCSPTPSDNRNVERGDVCEMVSDPGNCYARFPSFYYDKFSKTCKDFIWGGCGGNGNRFPTMEACMQRCVPSDGHFDSRNPERDDRNEGRDEWPISEPSVRPNPWEVERNPRPDREGGCQDLHGDNCNFRGEGGLEYAKSLCNHPDHRDRMRKYCCITCQRLDRQSG